MDLNGFEWICMDSDLSVSAVSMQKMMINQMEWSFTTFKQKKWEHLFWMHGTDECLKEHRAYLEQLQMQNVGCLKKETTDIKVFILGTGALYASDSGISGCLYVHNGSAGSIPVSDGLNV